MYVTDSWETMISWENAPLVQRLCADCGGVTSMCDVGSYFSNYIWKPCELSFLRFLVGEKI